MQHHKVHKTHFYIIKACDDVFKQQIISAYHNEYVEGVANENVGFAQTTILEHLNNLYE